MFDFHHDRRRYFDIQYRTSREHILPYLRERMDLSGPLRVLEIGCAEAGVLKAFWEAGHDCTGIELNPNRIEYARTFLQDELAAGERLRFIVRNIYDIDVARDLPHRYDLVILKDVIEHIPDQARFMARLHAFLAPGGKVFFGFPPWQMPFGGHQQITRNKYLSKLPYFHLLPRPAYRGLLRAFHEPEAVVTELLELKDTGLSIEAFERICADTGYTVIDRRLYLTNPIYSYKFNLKVRRQVAPVDKLPVLRNFMTTCAYYLVGPKGSGE